MSGSQQCPSPGELGAFERGELGADKRSSIEDHLMGCSACVSVLRNSGAAEETVAGYRKANAIDSTYNSVKSGLPPEARERPPTLSGLEPPSNGGSANETPPQARAILALLQPADEKDELARMSGYRLLKHIGSGGMGSVFWAEDLVLRRPTALKIMRPETQSTEGWARLLREARSMASIKHEHLATVYQAGREGEVFFLAMELLAGKPLDEWLKAHKLDVPEILRIAREIAVGLRVIHEHGLIHRDIKPSNIWIEAPDDKVKILDFGLARPMIVQGSTFVTQPGLVAGTPAFMSPEQARGEKLDPRSDLFSYGGVLYCLCTGKAPFAAETLIAQLTALAVDTPDPVHTINPNIPRALSDLVAKLLEKKPAARPESAEAVIEILDKIEGRPPEARRSVVRTPGSRPPARAMTDRKGIYAGLALVAAIAIGGTIYFMQPKTERRPAAVPEKTAPEKVAVTPAVSPAPTPVKAKPDELPREIAVDLGGAKLEMLLVAAGEFTMGNERGDPHEKPAHRVKISKPFYVAKYETTVAQFRAFVDATKYVTEAEKRGKAFPVIDGKFGELPGTQWRSPGFKQGDDHPVVIITWHDAREFCLWASGKLKDVIPISSPDEMWIMRLPLEAEWEYAARGPKSTLYPWGDTWEVRANLADATLKATGYPMHWGEIKESDGFVTTAPAGSFKNASWVGAFDMSGNVWEWCEDPFEKDYYKKSPPVDPPGPSDGPARIFRGGCWDGPPSGCTTTKRGYQSPGYPSGNIGFRAVAGLRRKQ